MPEYGKYIVENRRSGVQHGSDLLQHLTVERSVAKKGLVHIIQNEIVNRPVTVETDTTICIHPVPESGDIGMRGDAVVANGF